MSQENGRARETEESAASWLLRREEPEWTEQDQVDLDQWLNQSMAHKAAFWRLEHGWGLADRLAALAPLKQDAPPQDPRSWQRYWKPLSLAASVLIMIGIVGIMRTVPSPGGEQNIAQQDGSVLQSGQVRLATAIGEHKVVPLADGSKVELNTATKIRAAVTEASREIWIDEGEAFFVVKRSEKVPFVVHAGNRVITVLGTKFSVRKDGKKITVAVLEGRVRVDEMANGRVSRSATITNGDMAFTNEASTLVAIKSPERVATELSWRDGMLVFDQSTLTEAASEFNRYNKTQLIIGDVETANIRIGGTFQASNVDAFVRLLDDAYGLRVEQMENGVKISQ
ncbi:FecR domain-containing protein [uncultured Parasphingorhabdus sp.]|uniref:FecR family protein n=1 Tax=uncultured Parasphingorhabdus sp. TaxID=2709694 RepID=UPI0030DBED36|tara:strand:+ start:9284 stop:10303 length:1020 start_codon:yes stop_codon:yes gene_type:complete